jgi:hypothetical protein
MAVFQPMGYINNVKEDEIVAALELLRRNPSYLTQPVYRGNAEKWPGNQTSFVDYHISYLKANPTLNPHHYIANLRLMLKKDPNSH